MCKRKERLKKEIDAIFDNSLEYECITKTQHNIVVFFLFDSTEKTSFKIIERRETDALVRNCDFIRYTPPSLVFLKDVFSLHFSTSLKNELFCL